MIENLDRIKQEARTQIVNCPSRDELEKLRVHYVGKKGVITALLHSLKDLEADKRREMGARLNQIKQEFEKELGLKQSELDRKEIEKELSGSSKIDLTLPGLFSVQKGSLHQIGRAHV